mmetsp:Transcript_95506/g.255375  ORF Transcript_95506/g.255375 Transcript_95506/m.255375 type:complete len:175 (+) Transcript_95506:96-620(+)
MDGDLAGGGPGPRPRQPATGWGFGDSGPTAAAAAVTTGTTSVDDVTKKNKHWDEDDAQDVVIPELDDNANEDITNQVAQPAYVRGSVVRPPTDLDSGMRSQLHVGEDGVDLSILTQALCADHQVKEDDVEWHYETIFTEVAHEITAEMEQAEENAQASPAGGAPAGRDLSAPRR